MLTLGGNKTLSSLDISSRKRPIIPPPSLVNLQAMLQCSNGVRKDAEYSSMHRIIEVSPSGWLPDVHINQRYKACDFLVFIPLFLCSRNPVLTP